MYGLTLPETRLFWPIIRKFVLARELHSQFQECAYGN